MSDAIVDPDMELASETSLRDNYVAQLEGFMSDKRVLTAKRISLGDTKMDKQRKAAITEKLADLKKNTDALQQCIDDLDYIRARRDSMVVPPAGAKTAVAAAAATTSSAAPAAAQPAKTTTLKMPSKEFFPSWTSAGRTEPLGLRRWLLGVARVCKGHHLQEIDWRH